MEAMVLSLGGRLAISLGRRGRPQLDDYYKLKPQRVVVQTR
jgi:hypothetical protein